MKTARFEPEMPVRYAPGVGPRMSEKLARLGIATIADLLHYFPRDWEDRRSFRPIRDAKVGQETTYCGKVKETHFFETPRGFAIAKAVIEDRTGRLLCRWMRKRSPQYDVLAPFKREIRPGVTILVYGKIVLDYEGKSMNVAEVEVFSGGNEDMIHMDRIVPVYPLTEGVRQRFLRKLTYNVLSGATVVDPLPKPVRDSQGLISLQNALEQIHFPGSFEQKEKARTRLAFQEFFMIQTVMAVARRRRRVRRIRRYEIRRNLLTPFRERCGFEFTRSQKKVIREIFDDLQSEYPMNRLLQGDVGSGKTVVALSAMLLAAENGFQSVLMAPTEILAEQHFIAIKHLLKSLSVKVGLLTGSVKGKDRERFLDSCREGNLNIAVGTHALIEKSVRFANLGLAVIDEQHRFGVKERLRLTQTRPIPDVLVMTATPIPRTLALGLYGDLDISTIEELPPGRQKIETLCMSEKEAYRIAKEEIARKHQVYIVYPLVDENKSVKGTPKEEEDLFPALLREGADRNSMKAAVQEFEKLRKHSFKDTSIGLLHGQMPGKEKEKTMIAFHEGKFSTLVATTVIEVGIDVPNATVMVIQNAEHFGLSTLHQLRGRVGRGPARSRCILVGKPRTPEAQRRMDIILKSQNGFELAEADLELRGPGEFFGTTQHGAPPLKVADLISDQALILRSRKCAQEWLERDPDFTRSDNRILRDYLRKHFWKRWYWANIA